VRIKPWENDLVLEPTNQPTYSYLSELLKKYSIFMLWGILGVMLALPAFANEGDWKEKEALRDGQTRVWESMKAQEVKNPFTGEISINTVSHQYYEKADGLNYNIGTPKKPQWVPSVERIKATEDPYFPYQADEGPYKVKFGVSIDQTTPIEYSIGNDTIRLGLKYLAYYDKKNGTLNPFKTLNHVNPVVEGNKVIYKNAFTGIDVEYVYQKGVFQQNIKISSKSNLGTPSSYGISTDNAYLVAVTELDTTDFSIEFVNTKGEKMAQGLLKGESCDILFKKKGSILCTLAPSLAYADTEKGKKEINQYRHIYQDGNKQYLLEGISCQELGNLTAPLTLDYEIKTGGLSGNEVWKEGKTYYLSGNLTINAGATLVIEPGTICKYSTGRSLTAASGGRLIAKGDKFNYILMTSWNDNQVGETITNSNGTPQPSDYYCPINLPANTVTDHRIEYCKISYSGYGLNIQTGLDYPIQNNIIRNTGCYGIYLANEGLSGSHDVKNNLLVKNGISIAFVCGKDADGQMNIINNTIDQNIIGLYVTGDSFNLNCNIINNLFSSDTYGMYGDYIESHSYNKFYSVATPFHGNVSLGTGEDTTLENPYRASPNGSYYLNQNYNKVINAGTGTSANLGLAEKTTYAPSTAKAGDCPNHWVKINRDMDTVDIGYHYDPVDVVVGTSASDFAINYGTGLIAIDPGVVVSFYRDNTYHSAYFQLSGLGCVSTGGTPSDRVQFTSIYATSDLPTLPKRGGLDTYDYECAIYLNTGSKTVESSIQNCKFQYADEAVFTNISLNIDKAIRDNLFRKNVYGFCITNRMGNVVNNIFDSNQYAIWLFQTDESRQVNYLQSNTFYSNLTAIYAQQSINSQGKLTFRLENNILVGNKMGACGTGVTGGFTAETRNNVYWNNGSNVDGTWVHFNTLGGENSDTAVNPLFSHAARSQNSAWIPTNSDDGFYLAQRSGDANRFPLITSGIQSISVPYPTQFPTNTEIFVGVSSSTTTYEWGGTNFKGHLYVGGNYESGNQQGAGALWITLGDFGVCYGAENNLYDNAVVIITLTTGETIQVYLPQYSMNECEAVTFWVASDGSIYHANSNHSANLIYEQLSNQDAWYAMGYDVPNGLAKSAYDGGARSVAVDRGAVKVSNYQSSTYKYTLSVSTGYTNTNKVTQDNSSLYRVIPASLPAQIADPLGRLDAGFHYGGSVYFTTDIFNKNTEPSGHYDYYFMNDERRDIGAGEYDSNQLTGHQILTYTGISAGLEEHNWQTPCYHVLNTPVISPIDPNFKVLHDWYTEQQFQYPPTAEVTQIPVTVSPNGAIFCAFAVNHYTDTSGDYRYLQSGYSNHYLHIYRYRPDTLDWRLIAQYDTNGQIQETFDIVGIETTFHSLSLAASNDTVWVSWVEKRYSGSFDFDPYPGISIQTALCSAVVPADPVTVTHIGVSPNIVNTLVNQLYVFTGRSEQVSLTWDPYISSLLKAGVRIAFVNDQNSDNSADIIYNLLNTDGGVLSRNLTLDVLVDYSSKKASIVFNPNVNSSSYRAYIADNLENGAFYVKAHNLTDEVNETWTTDSYFSNIQGDHPDLSYRCTGSKLVAWDKYGYIQMPGLTNGLHLQGTAEYPRIGTDRVNNQDLFISWKDEYDTDGNSTLENVMAASELYP
jgi:hypothetical protein